MSCTPWKNETERANYWQAAWNTENKENERLVAERDTLKKELSDSRENHTDDSMWLQAEIVTLKSLSKSQLQTINALAKKLTTLKKALSDMLFAYQNKDGDYPHRFEIEALAEASILLKQTQEQEGKEC